MFKLDLYNFESPDAEDCQYILTSPRSLEACTRLSVKPVELLHKPLNDYIEDDAGVSSLRHLQNLFECRERQRLDLLRKCRQIREEIILEEKEILERSDRIFRYKSLERSFRETSDDNLYNDKPLSTDQKLNTSDSPTERLPSPALIVWDEDEEKLKKREKIFQEKLAMRNELIHKERLKQKRIKASQGFIKREEKAREQNVLKEMELRNTRSQCMIEEQEKIRRHQLLLKLEEQRKKKKKQERTLRHYEEEIEDYQQAVVKYQKRRLDKAEEHRLKELQSKQMEVKEKNRKKKLCHQERKKCIDKEVSVEQMTLEENIQLKQINNERLYRNQTLQKTQQMLENKQKEAQRKLKNQQIQKQHQNDLEDWQEAVKKYVKRSQARASVRSDWTAEQKALRAHEKRVMREKTHEELLKRVQKDDDCYRQYLWHQIAAKDARSKAFSEQREETKQVLRNAARRSSPVEHHTKAKNSRSFDKMVKEVELKASLSSGPQQARKNRSSLWLA